MIPRQSLEFHHVAYILIIPGAAPTCIRRLRSFLCRCPFGGHSVVSQRRSCVVSSRVRVFGRNQGIRRITKKGIAYLFPSAVHMLLCALSDRSVCRDCVCKHTYKNPTVITRCLSWHVYGVFTRPTVICAPVSKFRMF